MKKKLNIFIYIFGMMVFTVAATIIIALTSALDKKPIGMNSYEQFWNKFENNYYLVEKDFEAALQLGSIVGGAWLILNLVLLFIGGFDSKYYESVEQTLKMPFVRFLGVLIFSGVLGGALFFFMEFATSSREYPAHYNEWYQFSIVFALLGIILYYLVRWVRYLFRKRTKVV